MRVLEFVPQKIKRGPQTDNLQIDDHNNNIYCDANDANEYDNGDAYDDYYMSLCSE